MVIARRGDVEVWLEQREGVLWLGEGAAAGTGTGTGTGTVEVRANVLVATMGRYGRAFETGIEPPPPGPHDEHLVIEGVGTLRPFRFRGFGDVLPSDYLVLTPPAGEPLVAPAGMAAAALAVVARAAARAREIDRGGA